MLKCVLPAGLLDSAENGISDCIFYMDKRLEWHTDHVVGLVSPHTNTKCNRKYHSLLFKKCSHLVWCVVIHSEYLKCSLYIARISGGSFIVNKKALWWLFWQDIPFICFRTIATPRHLMACLRFCELYWLPRVNIFLLSLQWIHVLCWRMVDTHVENSLS